MASRIAAILFVSGFFAGAPATGVADEERLHASALQQATIYLKEYRFEPALTTLEAGKPAQLTLINNGKVVHEFITQALLNQAVVIKTRGIVAEAVGLEEVEISPGSKVVLLFTPEKAGEFAIACHASLPDDHFQKGMSGKLVIK